MMYIINITQFEHLKKGCPAAFEAIYAHYSKNIFWFGKRFIRDDFVIDTLVQDTFLKLWIHRDKIESPQHIYFFLRLVMKRACISYYTLPKNKFFRKINALEGYENYHEYLAGYDPNEDIEHVNEQEQQQQRYNQIKKIMPLLAAESSHIIALCLQYDFEYKTISHYMGTGITQTANKVKKALQAIKTIIDQGGTPETSQSTTNSIPVQTSLTGQQATVLKLRCEAKHSFAEIATALKVSQKEVHQEFMAAYKFLKDKHQLQLKSA